MSSASRPAWAPAGVLTAAPTEWPADEALGLPKKLIRMGSVERYGIAGRGDPPAWADDAAKQLWARVDEHGEVWVRMDQIYAAVDRHNGRNKVTRVHIESRWVGFDDFESNWPRFKQAFGGQSGGGFQGKWTFNKACSMPVDTSDMHDYEAEGREMNGGCAGDKQEPVSILSMEVPDRRWDKARTRRAWGEKFDSN